MKWLVHDAGGLFVQIADSLWEKEGDQVFYYTAWEATNPRYKDYSIGLDFGHLTKILTFEYYIDKVDVIVYLDSMGNGQCWYLRGKQPQRSIFGAGRGELLENDRIMFKQWIDQFKLPHNPYKIITGVDALVAYLKKEKNKYVKINIFRGDMESFFASDYESIECKLNEQIIPALGPHKNEHKFIVEDAIDAKVEIGLDGFFNGIDIIEPYFVGYELDKTLYIAHVADELPPTLEETMTPFSELMRQMDYRGAFSIEEKVKSIKEHYALDWCSRLANPLSALYPMYIKNFRELLLNVGARKPVEIDCDYKYLGAYPLITQEAKDSNVEIRIDPGHEKAIRYQMVTSRDKRNYAVKGWTIGAIIVAAGNSVDEVFANLKKELKHVHADGLDTGQICGEDKMREQIEIGKSVGIKFS